MFPVTVSHVCRAWRFLALHTPSLWRHISLDARLTMWSERIFRAKACSLDISLYLRFPPVHQQPYDINQRPRPIDARDVQTYMFHIMPYISRWRSLEIRFEGYAPHLWYAALSTCCFRSSPAVHANALKELTLVYPNNDDPKKFALFDGAAPRLRRVTLWGIRLAWTPSLFRNLSSLDYTHHAFSTGREAALEVLLILQVSARLETLRLAFPAENGGDGWSASASESERTGHAYAPSRADLRSSRRVHLAHLSLLELAVVGAGAQVPSSLVHIMYHLSLPALSALRFSHSPSSSTSAHLTRTRPLLAVLPPSVPLTYIRLSQRWLSPRFVSALVRLYSLRHLALSGQITRELLRALGESITARGRRLNVLELVRCTDLEMEDLAELQKPGGGSCVDEIWIRECGVDVDGRGFGAAVNALASRAVRVKVR